MNELPKVALGNSDIMVTRLISGGGQLCGFSHFSQEMDGDMKSYFTEEGVVKYLHSLQAAGINAIQARGDYHRLLHWMEMFRREGGSLHWIAQTASEMHDVFQNIRVIAAAGAAGIYHHGTRTDNFWLEGKIDKVADYLKCMRDSGVQVGLGSHTPEVIEYAEEKDWDIDFYMTCFYNLSKQPRKNLLGDTKTKNTHAEEFRLEDPPKMCRVIQQTDKMCLAFKTLGSSRRCDTQTEVEAAFKFAFSNIKPKDAVVVGMFPKYQDQIALNVKYVLDAC